MWLSEKALIFVDTRSAAVAVYKQGISGPRLMRFASERFSSRASQSSLFSDVLADSKDAVSRLSRELKAPPRNATLLLPLGAAFPSIVDVSAVMKAGGAEVDEAEAVRFKLAPLLPFPIAQAEVRAESSRSLGAGAVLAQAILKTTIWESEKVMSAIGFNRVHVTSTLSAALQGLPPWQGVVDLILGDSACAIAVRNDSGSIETIHLRLLIEGDDRAQRSIDEALRATTETRKIRVVGEDVALLRSRAADAVIHPAFEETPSPGSFSPQIFPFLAVFGGRAS